MKDCIELVADWLYVPDTGILEADVTLLGKNHDLGKIGKIEIINGDNGIDKIIHRFPLDNDKTMLRNTVLLGAEVISYKLIAEMNEIDTINSKMKKTEDLIEKRTGSMNLVVEVNIEDAVNALLEAIKSKK